jgi:hypothetical protein
LAVGDDDDMLVRTTLPCKPLARHHEAVLQISARGDAIDDQERQVFHVQFLGIAVEADDSQAIPWKLALHQGM